MRRIAADRRAVLSGGMAWASLEAVLGWAASPALAQQPVPVPAEPVEAIAPDHVRKLAERLAQREHVRPKADLAEPFNKLSYDQYRDIRFRQDQAIWRSEKLEYEVQLFPLGWLYDMPVEIWIVEGGKARQLKADSRLFTIGSLIDKSAGAAPFGFSGFRIHAPINRADYYDEFVVFQGASYFRAVGRGEGYGVSARGLAINTGRPGGEEFPFFRAFYIERPQSGSEIVVNALLDSPSTTGAYRFAIRPGPATVMDVEATLFPRREMGYVGIAPLTSMYLLGPAQKRIAGDFRPSVHDSEGLAILNGRGERLWRPLTNPKRLQQSSFVDKDPKGFGLSQRDRSFDNFEDLEAHYERRPTIWVEPKSAWGEGTVELIEIPVEEEIHDNIVAFWRPSKPLEAGKPVAYAYRLHWGEMIPVAWTGARVRKTYVGTLRKTGAFLFVVDFDGPAVKELRDLPAADISASTGGIGNVVVLRHPEIGGLRVHFELNPGNAELSELRLALKSNDQLISESWIYRWTRS